MDLRNRQITVGELLDNPKSKAVFQRRFGQFMKHPMVGAARSLSLAPGDGGGLHSSEDHPGHPAGAGTALIQL